MEKGEAEELGFGLLIVDDKIVRNASKPFILMYYLLSSSVPTLPARGTSFILPVGEENKAIFMSKLIAFLSYDDGSLGYEPEGEGAKEYYYLKGVRILIGHGSSEGSIGTGTRQVKASELENPLKKRLNELGSYDKNLGDLILLTCESCALVEKLSFLRDFYRIVCFERPVKVDRRFLFTFSSLLTSEPTENLDYYRYLSYAGVKVISGDKEYKDKTDINRELRSISEKFWRMIEKIKAYASEPQRLRLSIL